MPEPMPHDQNNQTPRRRRRMRWSGVYKQAAPVNSRGETYQGLEGKVRVDGMYDKLVANYREPTDDSPNTCNNCAAFVRSTYGNDGCEFVSGAVEWYGLCDLRIDVQTETIHLLSEQLAMSADEQEFLKSLAPLEKKIEKRGDKYVLRFSNGREEDFDSRAAAERRERQVNYFKHMNKSDTPARAFISSLSGKVADGPWDGAATRAAMSIDRLQKSALAFVGGDPDVKSNYRFLYKDLDGNVNANAVRAIKAVLEGARGPIDLPDSIKKHVETSAAAIVAKVQLEMNKADDKLFMASAPTAAIDSVYAEAKGVEPVTFSAKIVGTEIKKTRYADERITVGVVLAPLEMDAHNDVATAEDIEKACEAFNLGGQTMGDQHRTLGIEGAVLQSYCAPVDFIVQDITGKDQTIKKGSWIIKHRIDDEKLWEQIRKGEKTGYSFGGFGVRVPIKSIDELRA